MQSTPLHLVIIPTYNERDNLGPLLAAIWQAVPHMHVLFVDDNSPDGTADLIKSKIASTDGGRLHLLERPKKLGLGTAYISGFRWALARSYTAIIEMDADLSHNPAVLRSMLKELGGADVVVGSRYIEGGGTVNWSLYRKLISLGGSLYARTILGLKVRDLTGGFNAWKREVLETIGIDRVRSEGYAFQIELKYRANRRGFRILEIPIQFTERRAGQSKMSATIFFEAILRVWHLRFSKD